MKIIIHGGVAHFDEMCALSLIMAYKNLVPSEVELLRRNPTIEELEDPDVWVIDIGRRHEPELHNFDHHQDANLPGAFVLVAEFFNLDYLLKHVFEWWDVKSNFDTRGPQEVSQDLSVPRSILPKLYSPVEDFLLDFLAENPSKVLGFLKKFGTWMIETAGDIQAESVYLESCKIEDVGGFRALVVPDKHDINLKSMSLFMKRTKTPEIHIQICKDSPDRGNGWKVYRDDVHKSKIDFTRLIGNPLVDFAHLKGFMFTTKELIPLSSLFSLIETAFLV